MLPDAAELLGKPGAKERTELRARLAWAWKVLQERNCNQLLDFASLRRVGVFKKIEDLSYECWCALVILRDLSLRPALDVGHEQVREHFAILIVQMLLEQWLEHLEPIEQGTDKSHGRGAHGDLPSALRSSLRRLLATSRSEYEASGCFSSQFCRPRTVSSAFWMWNLPAVD